MQAEVDVGSLDSMEEVESMMPVKSIKEVKSIREVSCCKKHTKKTWIHLFFFLKQVKHITPIEEEVALAAIKKFRLQNQLENGDEPEDEDEDDFIRRLQESEEEIEEELEREQGMNVIVILDLELVLIIHMGNTQFRFGLRLFLKEIHVMLYLELNEDEVFVDNNVFFIFSCI